MLNGLPWFVLVDVCRVLEIGNSRMAADRLDDDERGVSSIDTLGGTQQVTVINESGLYSLILTSRKPVAKAFKKWVTSEVLPAIRKDGAYVDGEETRSFIQGI
jgi:prophage antirepressor-like protein